MGADSDNDLGQELGPAYIFTCQLAGRWVKTNKIVPTDEAAGDKFGRSVEISTHTVAVVAYP